MPEILETKIIGKEQRDVGNGAYDEEKLEKAIKTRINNNKSINY